MRRLTEKLDIEMSGIFTEIVPSEPQYRVIIHRLIANNRLGPLSMYLYQTITFS